METPLQRIYNYREEPALKLQEVYIMRFPWHVRLVELHIRVRDRRDWSPADDSDCARIVVGPVVVGFRLLSL